MMLQDFPQEIIEKRCKMMPKLKEAKGKGLRVSFSKSEPDKLIIVTFFGKTDTNAFPFIGRNRLQSVYNRLNGSCKRLNGLLICLKKFASV